METVTLANYRQRYAQYKTDPDLQAAHAAAPWLVIFDDHELDNNWADELPEEPQPGFLERR
ncbi:alkaline phosphatase, partial [Mycobacterium sp. ITM-2017-0098]